MSRRSLGPLPLVLPFSLSLLVSVSCSSGDDGGTSLPGVGSAGNGSGNGAGASTAVGGSGGGVAIVAGASSSGAVGGVTIVIPVAGAGGKSSMPGKGNGLPENCDGLDNDENGIVDDVDAGGDGVCDCLSIATLGEIGPWSNGGNIFESWLNARSPQGAVALGDQTLTPELLAPFQVIVSLHVASLEISNNGRIVQANHAYADSEIAAFQAWVRGGGGIMTTIGYSHDEATEVVNINRLLAPLGVGYSTSRLDLAGFVTNWEPHPVTDGVRNIFTENGVEPEGSGTVVAMADGDRVALRVAEADRGRVVIWGDEWITYDSEWEDVDDQQVELFWLNLLKWLSPPTQCQVPIPPTIPR